MTAVEPSRAKRLHAVIAVIVLCFLHLTWVAGQERTGTFSTDVIHQLPPAPSLLDENCVVAILNRTTTVNHDGTWILPSVPAGFGLVRARATCVRNGITRFGQSDLFTIAPNQSITLPRIALGNVSPIPRSIGITASTTTLNQSGQAVQLTVTATFSDGSTQNITASSNGTQYRSSNSAVASVNANGLVTAVGSGTAIIQALDEGAQGIISIQVALSIDSDGDGIPDDAELRLGLNPHDPTDALLDLDHDGLTNLQEFQNGSDINNPDSDGDGLTDGQEVLVYHTNPTLVDSDGDGIPDGIEVQTGSDPKNPSSFNLGAALSSITVQPALFTLNVNSIEGTASQQLTVTGHLIDGKSTIDLTSTTKGTQYQSSDLTICNFGAPDGNVFAGASGPCTITITNGTFSTQATGMVNSPFSPTALSFISIPGFANSVAVNGDFASVAAGSAGLEVVNVSNRASPTIVGSLALAGNANDVKVVGNLAIVAVGTAGIQAIDVSNPAAPAVLGTLSTAGTALDVAIAGNVAYVANTTGLFLANIAVPSSMARISSIGLAGNVRGVVVDSQRNLAVVSAGNSGIYVIDVSNPFSPVQRSNLAISDAHQAAIKGNYAFVANYHSLAESYQSSLVAVDISNPAAPVIASSLTNQSLSGNNNDVVISGNFALGADVFFVNGVPIADISIPISLQARAILNFTQRDDNGMGIAADSAFVYLVTEHSAIEKFGTSGDSRLYIGQFLQRQDNLGIPPAVAITSPAAGATVAQGTPVIVSVSATDDIAVSSVALQLNGQTVATTTAFPYQLRFTVPTGVSTITIGATATDLGNNVGKSADVVLNVVPDPGTTVVGRVLFQGRPAAGVTVTANGGASSLTAADGSFTIQGVPTALGNISVTATVTGSSLTQTSASVLPVGGGITNVGDIILLNQPLIIVDSTNGAVSALNISQNPPTVIPTTGASSPEGVTVTPDGTEALVATGNVLRMYDLTKNPPPFIGDISLGTLSALTSVVTTDGRFALITANQNTAASINLTSKTIVSQLSLPFANSIAVTPDNTTAIVADANSNVFRVLALSPQGVLTDTGATVPYTFNFWSPNTAIAPNGRFALRANPQGGFVSILRIDAQHNMTLSNTSIPVCCWPWGIEFTADGTKAYVTIPGAESPARGQPGSVAVLSIDASDNVTDTGTRIPIPNGLPLAPGGFNGGPSGIAIALDGRAYISNTINNPNNQSTVTIVDTRTDSVVGTVAVPAVPAGIGAQKSVFSGPVVVNFESISGITPMSNSPGSVVPTAARLGSQLQFAQGVTLSSTANYIAVVSLGAGHATSGTNGIGGVNASNQLSYGDKVVATFTVPGNPSAPGVTDFVSIRGDQLPGSGNSATMQAFDINGALLGSVTAPDVSGGLKLSLSMPGIHSVVVTEVQPNIAFDDLTFDPPTAP